MHIKFRKNGIIKEVKHGFSWTIFFFSWIPLLTRGMYIHAILAFILFLPTFGLWSLIMAFIGNKLYAQHLLNDGWQCDEIIPSDWLN